MLRLHEGSREMVKVKFVRASWTDRIDVLPYVYLYCRGSCLGGESRKHYVGSPKWRQADPRGKPIAGSRIARVSGV